MTENPAGLHPNLERLVALEEGRVSGAEAESLRAHLADCPLCRLELKRLARFDTLAEDSDALADAEWDRAELALQRGFEQKVRPVLRERGKRRSGAGRWLRLVPVAAAAVLVVAVLNFDRPGTLDPIPFGEDSLRGGGMEQSPIRLLEPSEQIAAPPVEFAWESDREFDVYILEVFSPDLEPVFRMSDLRETRVTVPDSLLGLLESGPTYLWNVQGRSGLADAELSLTGWFRIGKPAVGKL